MKIFRNKIVIKIIASLCIVLTIINMNVHNVSFAAEYDGDILINPITNLLVSICDGIIGILHKTIQYQDLSLIHISGEPNWWKQHGKDVITAVVVGIALVVGIIVTGGAIVTAGGIAKGIWAGIKVASAIGGIEWVSTTFFKTEAVTGISSWVVEKLGNWFSGTLYMPVFTLTPRYIFSNQVPMFDINFFNPMEKNIKTKEQTKTMELKFAKIDDFYKDTATSAEKPWYSIFEYDQIWPSGTYTCDYYNWHEDFEETNGATGGQCPAVFATFDIINSEAEVSFDFKGDTRYYISWNGAENDEPPGENEIIFYIRMGGADTDIMYKVKYTKLSTGEVEINIYQREFTLEAPMKLTENIEIISSADYLNEVVSKWYVTLKNLAILILLIILIYVGIRIVIGSTAGQKAKYKERLIDWLVALCLLFVMHYIMIFAVDLTQRFTELISTLREPSGTATIVPLKKEHIWSIEEMEEGQETGEYTEEYKAFSKFGSLNEEKKELLWISDIMGKMRILSQISEEGTLKWIGYSICYMVLVIYTIFFSWTYLKRVVYMAFLTIIAPMVAMTYPIDKINDGKAQAFSMWLKEYIFNLLIQPMHLLLYTVLVLSAYMLAATHPLYAIVAIGFITPAEKLVRKFFGFTKAQTPGAIGGAAGAALAYTGLQSVMKLGKGLKGDPKEEKEKEDKFKTAGKEKVDPKGEVLNKVTDKNDNQASPRTPSTNQSSNSRIISSSSVERDTDSAPPVERDTDSASPSDPDPNPDPNPDPDPDPDLPPPLEPDQEQPSELDQESPSDLDPSQNAKPEDKQTPASSNNGKKRKFSIRGAGRATKAAAGSYVRHLGRKMYKRVDKARPIRAIARGAAGIYGGALLGMAGVALGVTSGDPSKAFQYGTAGATGGYHLGKGVAGTAMNVAHINTKQAYDEMLLAYHGKNKYIELKNEAEILKKANDPDNIWKFRQLTGVSRSEAIEILRGDVGRKCHDAQFTKMEDYAAVYTASKKDKNRKFNYDSRSGYSWN